MLVRQRLGEGLRSGHDCADGISTAHGEGCWSGGAEQGRAGAGKSVLLPGDVVGLRCLPVVARLQRRACVGRTGSARAGRGPGQFGVRYGSWSRGEGGGSRRGENGRSEWVLLDAWIS